MLEDHSPTSRSSSRKPFRRKGAKTVIFNNSCTYYQLDSLSYDTSDAEEEEEEDTEDLITDGQFEELDEEVSEVDSNPPGERVDTLQRRKDDLVEMNAMIDNEVDAPHPSPRIGLEPLDYSGMFP